MADRIDEMAEARRLALTLQATLLTGEWVDDLPEGVYELLSDLMEAVLDA